MLLCGSVNGQPVARRTLTLDDALALAEGASEQVVVGQASIERARNGQLRVQSERRPQLVAAASYDRTLASEFEQFFESSGPSCTPLQANPGAPLIDRVAELERAYDCPSGGFGGLFGGGEGNELPFGQANAYRLNLHLSQSLYSGGRITALERQASLVHQNASLSLASTRAQLALDVAQAFYDAALADRLVAIADASVAQASRAYEQTRTQREAGRQSEFEVLRAQVARDTLRPESIRGRAVRDIAYLRLKQILELPLSLELDLVADLDGDTLDTADRFVRSLADAERGQGGDRLALTQLANDVRAREAGIDVVRAQRLPSAQLVSSYGRVGYRGYPSLGRTNWTVGGSVSLSILTGGRLQAEEAAARADLQQSRAILTLSRELAVLDVESARRALTATRAAWEVTLGTVQQAERAYAIAELRYREGISTQLELSDARLLLEQAQVNRARAARDFQVARVRVAVLPELPLTMIAAAMGGGR